MTPSARPHRPSYQEPAALEALAERHDPIARLHAAHETAAVLLRAGHENPDPALAHRLVAAVDEIGLPALADLWEQRPARTLPGALYRLYVLREWVARDPHGVSAEYRTGRGADAIAHLVVDVDIPSPDELRRLVDEILRGAFTGDVADALERAGAFCRVVAAGRAERDGAGRDVARLRGLATDLIAAARLWQAGELE